jgi:diacylglycerol kinase (ATP)
MSPAQCEKARSKRYSGWCGAHNSSCCSNRIHTLFLIWGFFHRPYVKTLSGECFIAFILVVILVVITKTYFGRGLPLRGGMPSGHAALAFSAWVAITYITENFIASLLSFVIAVIIAQSRVITKAHTPWEVILGSLMGASVTFLLFRLFS